MEYGNKPKLVRSDKPDVGLDLSQMQLASLHCAISVILNLIPIMQYF